MLIANNIADRPLLSELAEKRNVKLISLALFLLRSAGPHSFHGARPERKHVMVAAIILIIFGLVERPVLELLGQGS